MLLLVETLHPVARIFILSEPSLICIRVELGVFLPAFIIYSSPFELVHCTSNVNLCRQ